MQTGVLNEENLGQVLRGISQKRQQGMLEITLQSRKVDVYFIQGKVVDAHESDKNEIDVVIDALKAGKVVSQDYVTEAETYRDLLNALLENEDAIEEFIDEDLFKHVLEHRILDKLYSIDFGTGAYYLFKAQMIDVDRELSPNISVGQLLLDFVSLTSEAEKFQNLFMQAKTVVFARDPGASNLNEEEQIIFDCIESDGSPIESVCERSMLSRYHVQEAMLSLHEQGVLEVRAENTADTPSPLNDSFDDIVSVLEESLDSEYEESSRVGDSLVSHDSLTEEELEESEYDSEDIDFQGPSYLGVLNARLLQKKWLPNVIIFLFLFSAILAPLLIWGEVFTKFSDI